MERHGGSGGMERGGSGTVEDGERDEGAGWDGERMMRRRRENFVDKLFDVVYNIVGNRFWAYLIISR